MRRTFLITLAAAAFALLGAGSAMAVVVPLGASGRAGVALVPGTSSDLAKAGITPVTANAPCTDPALPPDLGINHVFPGGTLPASATGLCWHTGGSVLHANETFAVTWDPLRRYWATTRGYVEQFLRNVADASSSLFTPYAVVSQYTDATGRAGHASLYGGGCIDYGDPGGATCRFANAVTSTVGQPYPTSGCQVKGALACLTDDQLQAELKTTIGEMGFVHRTQSGYTPLVVLLLPSGVDTCLKAGALCSAGSGAKAEFCSYHSQLTMPDGTRVPYVVQPWSAYTGCDEPDVPKLSDPPTTEEVATNAGMRLVSPLSAAQIASIVNPGLDAWFANNGSEINDNLGCGPEAKVDGASLAGGSYYLQREFNDAAAIESDPNAQACEILVSLWPTFVSPSPIDAGDVVAFDGSISVSTLVVPKAGYAWSFGDGTVATGPSVVHAFAKAGVYSVRLTLTDRGGNVAAATQQVTVTGSGGNSPPPPNTKTKLKARVALIPQSYKSMLRSGIALQVTSNEPADGFSTILISRSAAKHAHLRTGRSASVVVGRGTVSGIKNGTVRLHLRLSRAMTNKLGRLRHLKLTVRLSLTGSTGDKGTAVAAGSY